MVNWNLILVAGAGKGIGKAVADLAIERGYGIIAVSRKRKDLQRKVNSHFVYQNIVCDLNNESSVSLLAPYAPKVCAVINCTGTHNGVKTFGKGFPEEVRGVIALNTIPALHLYEAFLSEFRERRYGQNYGRFVHISSGALDSHDPSEVGYCASKAALESLVLCLQNEDTQLGNKVSHHAVRVSLTDTPLARKVCPQITNWSPFYTARETAGILLDVALNPGNYPLPVVKPLYRPIR